MASGGSFAAAALLAIAVPPVVHAPAVQQRFTLVDRTLICRAAPNTAGMTEIWTGASAAGRDAQGARWNTSAGAGLGTGERPSFSVLNVSTGFHAGEEFRRHAGVLINTARCTQTRTTIPLSSRGLSGAFPRSYECRGVGRRIIVRVRARFVAPTRWSGALARGDLTERAQRASGRISEAFVAVRTYPRGRPLSFAAVNGVKGTARVYVALACQ